MEQRISIHSLSDHNKQVVLRLGSGLARAPNGDIIIDLQVGAGLIRQPDGSLILDLAYVQGFVDFLLPPAIQAGIEADKAAQRAADAARRAAIHHEKDAEESRVRRAFYASRARWQQYWAAMSPAEQSEYNRRKHIRDNSGLRQFNHLTGSDNYNQSGHFMS